MTENAAWGNGASLGEEAVLADSGRADEVAAGVGRVRMSEFSAADYSSRMAPCRTVICVTGLPEDFSSVGICSLR